MVVGHAVKPGAERGFKPKVFQPPVGFKEDLLGGVFRVGRVFHEREAEAVDAVLMETDQFGVVLGVAVEDPLDDFLIGCGAHGLPL
jgi:hypothetical protein